MSDWQYPRWWMERIPEGGSGQWTFKVYVDEHGEVRTTFAADPTSRVTFESVQAEIVEKLKATLDLSPYPANHPDGPDLDGPALAVNVTSTTSRAGHGPLGAPHELLRFSVRELVAIGLVAAQRSARQW